MELTDAVQNAIDVDLLTLASKGLLKAGGTDPTDPANATTAAEFLADVYSGVDGALASSISQVKLLVGPETYGFMGGLVYDTGSGMTVVDKMASIGVDVMVSDNVGPYQNQDQDGLVIVGPPRRNSVGVMWNGVEIIRDEFTKAPEGQVKFTVLVMWDFENVRTDRLHPKVLPQVRGRGAAWRRFYIAAQRPAGRLRRLRRLLAAATVPTVMVDFQSLYAGCLGHRARP